MGGSFALETASVMQKQSLNAGHDTPMAKTSSERLQSVQSLFSEQVLVSHSRCGPPTQGLDSCPNG